MALYVIAGTGSKNMEMDESAGMYIFFYLSRDCLVQEVAAFFVVIHPPPRMAVLSSIIREEKWKLLFKEEENAKVFF